MIAMSESVLLSNIKSALVNLRQLQADCEYEYGGEDGIYRFYHHSYKVYGLQKFTSRILSTLRGLVPGRPLNHDFEAIIKDGTNRAFEISHNRDWIRQTRPIIEAYFHAKYMLDMAIKYGQNMEAAPSLLPSGWAALLYLYNMR
jgi:hypothetical protein